MLSGFAEERGHFAASSMFENPSGGIDAYYHSCGMAFEEVAEGIEKSFV